MKRTWKPLNCAGLLVAIISLSFIGISLTYGSQVAKSGRWSFDFKNCSIKEALVQISQVTGIKILINKTMDKTLVNKSYHDRTINQVLNDLFRYENRMIAFYPNQDGSEILKIWVLGKGGDGEKIASQGAPEVTDLPSPYKEERQDSVTERKRLRKIDGQHLFHLQGKAGSFSKGLVKSEEAGSIVLNTGDTSVQARAIPSLPTVPEKASNLEAPPMPPGLNK